MTKKDYELVADTFRYLLNHCDNDEERNLIEWSATHMADRFYSANPSRFNRDRFLKACGVS